MMPICHMFKVTQILLLSVVLALLPLSVQAKIYLLSVGISDYPGTRNDLRLPHNDAATMQWLYKENKQAKVCLLMNDKAKVATVKKALQKMVSVATADDIVVIFFSGHGVKGGFVCLSTMLLARLHSTCDDILLRMVLSLLFCYLANLHQIIDERVVLRAEDDTCRSVF